MRSIISSQLRGHLYVIGGLTFVVEKGIRKRLGSRFGYILITTAPITTMLMAAERGKDFIFLGIGVRIYTRNLS